ncbi:hypothetical protein BGW80DRAFT_1308904, partial [Lactifluus volemus]
MTSLRYLFTFSPALVYSDAGAECTPWRCRTSYASVTDRACPGRSCVGNVTMMRRLHSRPDAKVFPSEKRDLTIARVCRNKNRMGLRAGQGKTRVQHGYRIGRCPCSRKKKYATD